MLLITSFWVTTNGWIAFKNILYLNYIYILRDYKKIKSGLLFTFVIKCEHVSFTWLCLAKSMWVKSSWDMLVSHNIWTVFSRGAAKCTYTSAGLDCESVCTASQRFSCQTLWFIHRCGRSRAGHSCSCFWQRLSLRPRTWHACREGIPRALSYQRMGTSFWEESFLFTAVGLKVKIPFYTNRCHYSAPGKLFIKKTMVSSSHAEYQNRTIYLYVCFPMLFFSAFMRWYLVEHFVFYVANN